MTGVDPVDAIMVVMNEAFDPRYGEAWTRRQVADALVTPNTHVLLDLPDVEQFAPETTRGFTLSRQAADEEELLLIAVRPRFRESGVGGALMRRFLAAAGARGTRKVFLEMRAGNPAEHLYHATGFAQVGLRKGYYRGAVGGPLDAVTFVLNIDPDE
ncbi:MAG: GNAT family N-acetyltransferase [Alteraurantiacibacter sp.]